MNTHETFQEQIPLLAAGQIPTEQVEALESHLHGCAACQADLALWRAVAAEMDGSDSPVPVPVSPVDRALERIHTPRGLFPALRHTGQLLLAQAMLVQREMWPVSAMVMAMGVVVALISVKAQVIYFLAPLVAAATLAMLYGPDQDPAMELSLSTPISPWKILLARMSVVSAFNLVIALLASLALLFIVPSSLLGGLILGWLGPMAFLSALALLLSIWMGTNNAVAIAYGLWMLQYIQFVTIRLWVNSPAWEAALAAYWQFWHSPALLLLLSAVVIALALWSANRPVFRLARASI